MQHTSCACPWCQGHSRDITTKVTAHRSGQDWLTSASHAGVSAGHAGAGGSAGLVASLVGTHAALLAELVLGRSCRINYLNHDTGHILYFWIEELVWSQFLQHGEAGTPESTGDVARSSSESCESGLRESKQEGRATRLTGDMGLDLLHRAGLAASVSALHSTKILRSACGYLPAVSWDLRGSVHP